jgi:hypothetical protein
MMNPVRFADLCDNVQNMNKEQLRTLAQMCEERIDERQERFEHLCSGLYDYLQTIFDEFPNAHVYLCKDGKCITTWEKFDLSSLGAVARIEFNIGASEDQSGSYGLNCPAYFAYDDVAVRF